MIEKTIHLLKAKITFDSDKNYSEPLVIDTTSDCNYIEDKPPAVISGNNASRLVITFKRQLNCVIEVSLMGPAGLVSVGIGRNESISYYPNRLKTS